MSAALLALLISAGGSVWVFTKLQNKTGYGNNQSAFIGSAVTFVIGFIVLFSLAHMILH